MSGLGERLAAAMVLLAIASGGWFFGNLCRALWRDWRHPEACVRYAPPPPCGRETVCVDAGGNYCRRYADACTQPGECLEWRRQ